MLFGEEASTPHLKQEAENVAQEVKGSCVSKVQGTELTEELGERFKKAEFGLADLYPRNPQHQRHCC